MKITDVENLPFAELKARKDEIVRAMFANEDAKVLAARYVQARTDAKMRDEELQRQSKLVEAANHAAAEAHSDAAKKAEVIGKLTEANAALQGNVKALENELEARAATVSEMYESIAIRERNLAEFSAQVDDLTAALEAERAKGEDGA